MGLWPDPLQAFLMFLPPGEKAVPVGRLVRQLLMESWPLLARRWALIGVGKVGGWRESMKVMYLGRRGWQEDRMGFRNGPGGDENL